MLSRSPRGHAGTGTLCRERSDPRDFGRAQQPQGTERAEGCGQGYFSPEVTHAYPGVTHGEMGPGAAQGCGTAWHTWHTQISTRTGSSRAAVPDPRLRESPFQCPPQVQRRKERSDTDVLWESLVK